MYSLLGSRLASLSQTLGYVSVAKDLPVGVPNIDVKTFTTTHFEHLEEYLGHQDSLHPQHAKLTFDHLVLEDSSKKDPGFRLAELAKVPSFSEVKRRVDAIIVEEKLQEKKVQEHMLMADSTSGNAAVALALHRAAVMSALTTNSKS